MNGNIHGEMRNHRSNHQKSEKVARYATTNRYAFLTQKL